MKPARMRSRWVKILPWYYTEASTPSRRADNDAAIDESASHAACGCWKCSQEYVKLGDGPSALFMPTRFIVCSDCGNKRCPKATHHDNACSGSNDPGQVGSRFESISPVFPGVGGTS